MFSSDVVRYTRCARYDRPLSFRGQRPRESPWDRLAALGMTGRCGWWCQGMDHRARWGPFSSPVVPRGGPPGTVDGGRYPVTLRQAQGPLRDRREIPGQAGNDGNCLREQKRPYLLTERVKRRLREQNRGILFTQEITYIYQSVKVKHTPGFFF